MWTVRNSVGNLVEARLTRVDSNALSECLSAITALVRSREQPVVGIFDMAQVRVLGRSDADLLLGVMRRDNPRVKRTAILVSGDALLEMQMQRLTKAAGTTDRQVFRAGADALGWLGEVLSVTEAARARAFLDE